MTIHFGYEKKKVLQALRYHFISRPEIRIMLILVNVFALASILLYAFKKVTPIAFLTGSLLWIVLMISFWFILPYSVYKRAITFRHEFTMDFESDGFTLRHVRGPEDIERRVGVHRSQSNSAGQSTMNEKSIEDSWPSMPGTTPPAGVRRVRV